MEYIATVLKALGHTERLRILNLLSHGDLSVSELVYILDLSQPRVTQYIHSLAQLGIIERLKEGHWVFSRLQSRYKTTSALVATALAALPKSDPLLNRDMLRLEKVHAERAKIAEAFFANVANDCDRLGDEYLPQADIEAHMRRLIGGEHIEYMVDLGTGTGRLLHVFASQVTRATGIDNNREMLKVARHNLVVSGHKHLTVQQGDLYGTVLESGVADLVSLHQVLHYLERPQEAISEAARLLKTGGRLLIVDFSVHEFTQFQQDYAHLWLGFSSENMQSWLAMADMSLQSCEIFPSHKKRPDVVMWVADRAQNLQQVL